MGPQVQANKPALNTTVSTKVVLQLLLCCAGLQGRTALHIAVIHGHAKCVDVLASWSEDNGLPCLEVADDHVSI